MSQSDLDFLRRRKTKRTTDVGLQGLCESLIAIYSLSRKKDVLNLNIYDRCVICDQINLILKEKDIFGFCKNLSHMLRLYYISKADINIEKTFLFPEYMYLGRSLPPVEASKTTIISTLMTFGEPSVETDGTGPLNVLYGWNGGKERPSIFYSESACLFNTRERGGQARILKDLIMVFRESEDEDDYTILTRAALTLELQYIDHIVGCKGCDKAHLHYPFGLFSIPESGYKSRNVTLTSPFITCFTSSIQKRYKEKIKGDKVTGPAFCGEYKVPVGQGKYFSIDYSKATDNFSFSLMRYFLKGIHSNCRNDIEKMYSAISMLPGRVFEVKKRRNWPGLLYFVENFLWSVPRKRVAEIIDDMDININAIRIWRKRGGNEKDYSSFYNPYRNYNNPEKEYTSFEDHRIRKVILNHRLEIQQKIIAWWRGAYEEDLGTIQCRGQHMGLPLSFVTLSAVNKYLVIESGGQGVTMGDDCVLLGTDLNYDLYCKNAERLGLVLNKEKTYISECNALFCERFFHKGKEQSIIRAKTLVQPNKDFASIFDDMDIINRSFRVMKYHNIVIDLLLKGWCFFAPTFLYGLDLRAEALDRIEAFSLIKCKGKLNSIFLDPTFQDESILQLFIGIRQSDEGWKISEIVPKALLKIGKFHKKFIRREKLQMAEYSRIMEALDITNDKTVKLFTSQLIKEIMS